MKRPPDEFPFQFHSNRSCRHRSAPARQSLGSKQDDVYDAIVEEITNFRSTYELSFGG